MYATHDRRWWTLSILCLSMVMVVLGNTVLNVALPTLQRELDASGTELQWMVDGYILVFAGLLLTAGAIGDRFGRKRTLNAGLVLFGTASLAATQATAPEHLIAARVIMGVAAAFVMPATLSILANVFPTKERAKAIGIWAGLSGVGAALGPIAGGWLLEHFSWSAVFYLNAPVVLAAIVGGALVVPSSRDPERTPLDPVGAFLSMVGLAALIYAIIEAPNDGWLDPITLVGFLVAIVLLLLFGAWELRRARPMLDLRLFRNPRFTVASGALTVTFFTMVGLFFLLTQLFQFVRGYSPFEAGLHSLPAPITIMLVAPRCSRLVERFGPRRVVTTGMAFTTLSLVMLGLTRVDSPYLYLVVAFVALGVGMGLTGPAATTSIMASVPLGKAGVGSAVNDTTRELGGALGVAVLGSLYASTFTSSMKDAIAGLPTAAAERAGSSVGNAVRVGESIGGDGGTALIDAGHQAFIDGLQVASFTAAALIAAAALCVAKWFPGRSQDVRGAVVGAEPAVVGPVSEVAR